MRRGKAPAHLLELVPTNAVEIGPKPHDLVETVAEHGPPRHGRQVGDGGEPAAQMVRRLVECLLGEPSVVEVPSGVKQRGMALGLGDSRGPDLICEACRYR
ncbi:MAG: hypothetical protein ACRDZO_20645 [Egibacteraceae bacterium]